MTKQIKQEAKRTDLIGLVEWIHCASWMALDQHWLKVSLFADIWVFMGMWDPELQSVGSVQPTHRDSWAVQSIMVNNEGPIGLTYAT